MLTRLVQNGPKVLTGLITLMLLVTSIVLTASLSALVASLYAVVFTFMMFGAPGLLIWAQRFKKYVNLAARNFDEPLIFSIQ